MRNISLVRRSALGLGLVLAMTSEARADGDRVFGETLVMRGKGLGAGSFGVGLAGRRPGPDAPVLEETIEITGLPAGAIIERAYLYWITLGTTGSPSMTLDGTALTGTLIGTAPNTCWVGWEQAQNFVYRVDIKDRVTGNGERKLTGFPSGGLPADTQGASIFVVYTDPAANHAGIVHLLDGSLWMGSVDGSGGASGVATFANFVAPAVTERATLFLPAGDGQTNLSDGLLSFNGLTLRPDGGAATTQFRGSAGFYWDQIEHEVGTRITPTTRNPRLVINFDQDCLVFPYTALALRAPAGDYGDAGPTTSSGGPGSEEDGGGASSGGTSSGGTSSGAGTAPADGGSIPVGNAADPDGADGCGCRTANASRHLPFATLAIAMGLAWRLRRRRR